MIRYLVLATLSAAAVFCQALPVGVFLQFDAKPTAFAVEVMKKEVDRLLKPSGLLLNWRMAAANEGRESFARLVLVRFKGSCSLESVPDAFGSLGETVALASTKVGESGPLPFSEVECDQVRKVLSYATGQRAVALGLALGKVVAHEIYHMLARSTAHSATGLTKATQTWKELGARQTAPLEFSFRRGSEQRH